MRIRILGLLAGANLTLLDSGQMRALSTACCNRMTHGLSLLLMDSQQERFLGCCENDRMGLPTGLWILFGIMATVALAMPADWIIGFYNEGEQNDE